MESHISPADIAARSEAIVEKPVVETPAVTPEVKAPEVVAPEVKAPEVKAPEVKAPEVKVEVKSEAKQPNDPAELRKWATKASQENAELRKEMESLKTAIAKLSKKPIDYKELAKNPDSIKAQIELERQEAVAEMQTQLKEKEMLASKNETIVEKMKREQDATNYPEWKRVFPLIQNLANNSDGRVNFNQKPGDVLDALYALALELSPVQAAAIKAADPVVDPVVAAPVVAAKTPEQIALDIAAAEKRGFEKAQEALRAEQNGAGTGSAGKGGKRTSGMNKEALQTMDRNELKKLISKE